jgi:hypothetical protein
VLVGPANVTLVYQTNVTLVAATNLAVGGGCNQYHPFGGVSTAFSLFFHLQASRNASMVFPLELKSLIFVYLRGSPPAVFPFLTRFVPQISESPLQQPYQQLNSLLTTLHQAIKPLIYFSH